MGLIYNFVHTQFDSLIMTAVKIHYQIIVTKHQTGALLKHNKSCIIWLVRYFSSIKTFEYVLEHNWIDTDL